MAQLGDEVQASVAHYPSRRIRAEKAIQDDVSHLDGEDDLDRGTVLAT